MSVGQDLLDTPFPQMVQNLAFAIARGQMALDRSSMETTRQLAREKVKIIEEIQEVITPDIRTVDVTIQRPNDNGSGTALVSMAVESTPPKKVPVSVVSPAFTKDTVSNSCSVSSLPKPPPATTIALALLFWLLSPSMPDSCSWTLLTA